MKRYLILIILYAYQMNGFGQTSIKNPRGHYEELSEIDSAPRIDGEEVDQKRFPETPGSAERLKTYKLFYLRDVTPEDFVIP